jgi:hypothetical protein
VDDSVGVTLLIFVVSSGDKCKDDDMVLVGVNMDVPSIITEVVNSVDNLGTFSNVVNI